MNPATDQSKSRFFTIDGDNVVVVDQPDDDSSQLENLKDQVIDKKYRVLSLLGKGGMGAVYLAHHLMLNKDVALKTFSPGRVADNEALMRFQREAQSIAKLSHKNVVQVFDFGISEKGVPFYTMEHLEGESLADRLEKSGPLKVESALEFFIDICHGLSLAHSKGIVHRDLKPANLFIVSDRAGGDSRDTIKIVDFGIASLTNQTVSKQRLTATGAIFGSPLYMSPEQSMGEAISECSDIYTLGCTLFEALVGKPPFRGATAQKTIMMHHNTDPPTLREASGGKIFPEALERIVATMLSKSPNDRQASVEQIADELMSVSGASNRADSLSGTEVDFEEQKESTTGNTRGLITVRLRNLVLVFLLLAVGAFLAVDYSQRSKFEKPDQPGNTAQQGPPSGQADKLPRTGAVFKSQTILRNGKKYVIFQFPTDADMGEMTIKTHRIPIRGQEFQVDLQMMNFSPSRQFVGDPSNFEILPPDFLVSLNFKPAPITHNSDEYMKSIARQTKLYSLGLDDCQISDDDLEYLRPLKQMVTLSLDNTKISGAKVAQIPWIRNIVALSLRRCLHASDVLAKLRRSERLLGLYLDEDSLTTDDFKTISTFSNLEKLHVNNTGLNDQGLAALAALKNLKDLEIKDCPITPQGALEPLRRLSKRKLKKLELSEGEWSLADKNAVRKYLPNAKFVPSRVPPADIGNTVELFDLAR